MFKLKDGKSFEDFMKQSKELMTIWKDIEGYEGLYEVSNFGEIKSIERKVWNGKNCYRTQKERILKPGLSSCSKYLCVDLSKDGKSKTRNVHDLVLKAHVGSRPEGMQACHGPKGHLDNSVSNLYWGTPQQNNREDKLRDGTLARGEKHGCAKLTEEQVREIRKLALKGELTQKEIAEIFGITRANVSMLKRGKTWSHLKEEEE
jgi:predicted XRE-type DNA-binding protein